MGQFKHGMCGTPTYRAWHNMRVRCSWPKANDFHLYGGRGISYCAQWNKFANFLADMGPAPEGHSLDRIDPNGNYEPENCRWATLREQQNNRRDNVLLTYNGVTQTMMQWARQLGMTPNTLTSRITLYKWPVEKALSLPVRRGGHHKPRVKKSAAA